MSLTTALSIFIGTAVVFVVYVWLTSAENKRGKRLFFGGLRGALDALLSDMARAIRRKATYIVRNIITLSWYYSLHAFLRLSLQFLGGMYTVLEAVLHRNRDKARQIRRERKQAERSHLTELAEHKAETTLTPHQKEKRKAKALSGK